MVRGGLMESVVLWWFNVMVRGGLMVMVSWWFNVMVRGGS